MNILWLTPEFPWPSNSGGRIAIMKRIEYFSNENNIYLFSISDDIVFDNKYTNYLMKYCKSVRIYDRKKIKLKALFKLLSVPYMCCSRWSSKLKREIVKCYIEKKIDIVMVEFPQMLGNISRNILNSGKVILYQHNTEWMSLYSNGKSISNLIIRLIYYIESKRMKSLEKKFYLSYKIGLYAFVSTEDKSYFENEYKKNNTYLLPVGANIHNLGMPPKIVNSHKIVFVGKMSYYPNIYAAKWFINNVWGKVVDVVQDATIYFVGKDPSEEVNNLACDNVVVTGTVDSVESYYDMTNLIITPIFHGGGVKTKLLEALSYGKHVISTTKGIEGTDFKDNVQLTIADNADDFSKACIQGLLYPEKFTNIITKAKQEVERKFSWSSILRDYDKQLIHLLQ
jgi:glycosyltransferase involved in cell wall biosynthesis